MRARFLCTSFGLTLLLASNAACASWVAAEDCRVSRCDERPQIDGFVSMAHERRRDNDVKADSGQRDRHSWSMSDARHHVERDSRFHRYEFRGDGDDRLHRDWRHEGRDHCDVDDTPPHEAPLPPAALLFAPAFLLLRVFQRRAS